MLLGFASFAIATISLIVATLSFILGEKGHPIVRLVLGAPALLLTILFSFVGFYSFTQIGHSEALPVTQVVVVVTATSQPQPATTTIIPTQRSTPTIIVVTATVSNTQTRPPTSTPIPPTPTSTKVPPTPQPAPQIIVPSQPQYQSIASKSYTIQANLTWQDTGIQLQVGDQIKVEYVSGAWTGRSGDGGLSGPEGDSNSTNTDECFPIKYQGPTLIARIGNGTPFIIGRQYLSKAQQAGNLFLRMNDCDQWLYDNAGSVIVSIEQNR